MTERTRSEDREKAILVAATTGDVAEAQRSLEELALLADTAGADTVAAIVQPRRRFDPATLVGSGKVAELADIVRAEDADLVIFDNELSPAQERNLSKALGTRVLDRTALILDIFAQHAHSQEGRAQVELAQLRYLLPRLVGRGVELSRLGAGIGTRGPGETKLEVDRRRIRTRIAQLRRELEDLGRTRRTKRGRRRRTGMPVVSLVGYTNAGKSSLLNALTDAGVLVEDQLFATLDPTTRRVELPDGRSFLVTDTVGFVRKLPHQLVEAFRSTLEEVTEADLLLHVADVADPDVEEKIDAVRSVLAEIGAGAIEELLVGNKIDAASPTAIARFRERHPDAVLVSARTGEGLEALLEEVWRRLAAGHVETTLRIPYDEGAIVAGLHDVGEVLETRYDGDAIVVRARIPAATLRSLAAYEVPDEDALSADGSRHGGSDRGAAGEGPAGEVPPEARGTGRGRVRGGQEGDGHQGDGREGERQDGERREGGTQSAKGDPDVVTSVAPTTGDG